MAQKRTRVRKILCFLGFHSMEYIPLLTETKSFTEKECQFCSHTEKWWYA